MPEIIYFKNTPATIPPPSPADWMVAPLQSFRNFLTFLNSLLVSLNSKKKTFNQNMMIFNFI